MGPGEKRADTKSGKKLAGLPQLLQLSLQIGDLEFRRTIEGSVHHLFIFLAFQRTGGINEPPADRQLCKRGLQDVHLPRLKIVQVCGFEPPLDLWVASQSAGAGTRNVGEDVVEGRRERQLTRVRRNYAHIW